MHGKVSRETCSEVPQQLGDIDALKFHSCVTLFAQVAEADSPFHTALHRYFGGQPDHGTVRLLKR